ncbi:unnamed protein product [Rotaria sp. Silwood2]|nr:unnamed protein product [Rotaria sp. Silwood2]CAF3947521.1 unnamed protein product [Rotaria sp. Silwood2]
MFLSEIKSNYDRRYNKYSRRLSQTPWIIDGVRKADASVEELIALPISKLVAAKNHVFISSDREDVDIRTLGRGRPFVIEFRQLSRVLYRPEEFFTLQQEINMLTKDIRVRDLQQVTKRTLMTRQRSISALSATVIDPYHFRLHLTTQAGAYVKEFVHGDFG